MISDRKRFAIVRKDIIIAIKRARTLDDLISMMKRKYRELTGNDAVDGQQSINMSVSVNSQNVDNIEKSNEIVSKQPSPFEKPETFDRETVNPEVKMFTCPHCKEQIEFTPGTVFCPNCGMPID